jgi:alpha-ketoglutarate-dependent 2,4-dichlorophenoxyacetate dioxygenase
MLPYRNMAGERCMTITVTQLHPHFGAEIGGLDLREPIDAAAVQALWRAVDTHAVLVFS